MKDYTFILKPLFFVFSLIFSTWMVLAIEKVSPSDFGEYKTLFESQPAPMVKFSTHYIQQLFGQYKTGTIDSVQLQRKLETFLTGIQKISDKSRETKVADSH
ncbi:MAG: hypothetical protein WAQ28_19145 [Bacteroidia bacterium]|jgi:hypothetical protein